MEARTSNAKQVFQEFIAKLNTYISDNKTKMLDNKGALTKEGKEVALIAEVIIRYYQLPVKVNDILSKDNFSQRSPTLFSLAGMQEPAAHNAPDLFKNSFNKIRKILSNLQMTGSTRRGSLYSTMKPLTNEAHVEQAIFIIKELRKHADREKGKYEEESVKNEASNFDTLTSILPTEVWQHILSLADPKTKAHLNATSRFFNQVMHDDDFWKKEVSKLVGKEEDLERIRNFFDGETMIKQTYYQTYQRLVKIKAEEEKKTAKDKPWIEKIIELGADPKNARQYMLHGDNSVLETYEQAYNRLKEEKEAKSKPRLF